MKEAFSRIQPESWICDPWADIICKGKNFSDKWKFKMIEWEEKNMFIIAEDIENKKVNTNRYRTLFSPLREKIFHIIQEN
ncbi:hypothetical protein A9255_03325 [Xenorhabdus hominickii]|uniref:Uncharacterized protein n=1 Tax=Xenorhabdus hominickii TaxID=351679 RepID=A0A2G0Q2L5_XENHO|nr:hypothetical protein A9255_03325 [Xenorhabdus hominickii]PHM53463.1 hypothetical protein Xhom_03461 [Xenorhabdus hominickii]